MPVTWLSGDERGKAELSQVLPCPCSLLATSVGRQGWAKESQPASQDTPLSYQAQLSVSRAMGHKTKNIEYLHVFSYAIIIYMVRKNIERKEVKNIMKKNCPNCGKELEFEFRAKRIECVCGWLFNWGYKEKESNRARIYALIFGKD